MKETLTLMEIYRAARSTFIQDYNFQKEQCKEMKKRIECDPEHKERYKILLREFEKYKNESCDKILYMMELIGKEQEKTGESDICSFLL